MVALENLFIPRVICPMLRSNCCYCFSLRAFKYVSKQLEHTEYWSSSRAKADATIECCTNQNKTSGTTLNTVVKGWTGQDLAQSFPPPSSPFFLLPPPFTFIFLSFLLSSLFLSTFLVVLFCLLLFFQGSDRILG